MNPRWSALPTLDPVDMGLGDWLAAARDWPKSPATARTAPASALYGAIGRAYDFSLAAGDAPGEFDEFAGRRRADDAGPRADDAGGQARVRRRLRQDAAHRIRRRADSRASPETRRAARSARSSAAPRAGSRAWSRPSAGCARKRPARRSSRPTRRATRWPGSCARLPAQDFAALAPEGSEFALVMIRRTDAGEVVVAR